PAGANRCRWKSQPSREQMESPESRSSPERPTGTYSSSPSPLPAIGCTGLTLSQMTEGRIATAPEPTLTPISGGRPVVLVADDDQGIRALFRAALEREGFGVLLASNGRRAMQLVRSAPVSVMLLDLTCPVWTGSPRFGSCAKIRASGRCP